MPVDVKNGLEDALSFSLRVQSDASRQGFDWDHLDGVLAKVKEELGEIQSALDGGDEEHARRELGDLLLICTNLARFLDADPRDELYLATLRFEERFSQLKIALREAGKTIRSCTVEELEGYWQRIKPVADKALKKRLDMGPDDGANSRSGFYKTPIFKGQNEPVDNL